MDTNLISPPPPRSGLSFVGIRVIRGPKNPEVSTAGNPETPWNFDHE
jgi:hypothetical protein